MFKKASLVACAAVSVAGAFGVAAPTANAAPASSMYFHGTAKMTNFSSYGTCQSYAAGQVKNITFHGGKIVTGPDAGRIKCFPTSNGRWSYLLAYTTPKVISSGDYTYTQAAVAGDSFWVFDHTVSGPASTFTQAKCEANRNVFAQKVISGLQVRYLHSPACGVNTYTKTRGYMASYLGTSKTSGFTGDRGMLYRTSVLTEAAMLGYTIPGAI